MQLIIFHARSPSDSSPHGAARTRGFTLVELLTVLVVLVVLTMIAVPSFNELIASQRVQMAAMDVFTSLLRARSEAIKQNTDVTLAPAGTGQQGGLSPSVARMSKRTRRRTTSHQRSGSGDVSEFRQDRRHHLAQILGFRPHTPPRSDA